MVIDVHPLGDIEANCYTVLTDKAALVIDPGVFSDNILNFLKTNADKERLILITHSHFDHIGGAYKLRKLTNVDIAIGEKDSAGLSDNHLNLTERFSFCITPFSADILLKDDESFTLGDITVKCIETPGHTRGGMCYLIGNSLFSGDTLFMGTVGRTDFPGSDYLSLKNSLKKLSKLSPETVIYPGHGGYTTIAYEILNNLYMKTP